MFQVLMSEFHSFFKEKKHIIFISAILLVPIIYAGMFIWSFWSPYDHTDHLPVAVVNNDTGAMLAGEKVNLGQDLVKDLKKNNRFEWHFVSEKEARKGLDENKYYMTMTIPSDFSKNATTVLEKHPDKTVLYYHLNSGYNYIASKITDGGAQEIENKLNREITKTYTKNLFKKVNSLADGLKKAADGSGDLKDGAAKEFDGLNTIKTNLQKLGDAGVTFEDGAKALASGAADLNNGIRQVQTGSTKLLDKTRANTSKITALGAGAKTLAGKTAELNQGINQIISGDQEITSQLNSRELADGLASLSQGLTAEYQGLESLNEELGPSSELGSNIGQLNDWLSGVSTLFTEIDQYNGTLTGDQKVQFSKVKILSDQLASEMVANNYNELKQLPTMIQQLTDGQKKLIDGFNDLNTKLDDLANGLTELQSGIEQLPGSTGQLAAGAKQVSDGATTLNQEWGALTEGIGELNAGEQKLADGSLQLQRNLETLEQGLAKMNDGTGDLAGGATKLADGMNDIKNGAGDLSDKLNDAYGQTTAAHRTNDNVKMFADPVQSKTEAGTVDKYGQGFTPYFLSLGLFVGALLLTVIYNMRDPYLRPKNGATWAFGKYLFLMGIGLIQAIIADFVILGPIGLHVGSPVAFILFSILTSWTYMALVQFFVSSMGDPGRFLVVIILVLQLTTTGGTYPIELLPSVLYNFHQWLPMNYSVAGFRNLIAGGQVHMLWHNALMLGVFLVIMLMCSVVYLTIAYKKEFKNNEANQDELTA